jgi:ADP-heptose:LPS heptosyltransferase
VKNTEPKKIAVFCLSALGDFLNALPVLNALRKKFPGTRLIVVCERPATAQLSRTTGVADEVVLLPAGLRRNPIKLAQAALILRRLGAEIAVQTFASHGTCANLLLFCTGARVRVGLADGFFRAGATVAAPLEDSRHSIELNFGVLKAGGLVGLPRPTGRYLPMLENNSTNFGPDKLVASYAPYVAVATGCDPVLSFKRWSADKWAELGKRIASTGRKVVFLGDRAERAKVDPLIEKLGKESAVNLCGETTFEDLVAVVGGSDLMVGLDGMILHMSAAIAHPSVSLFGPTDEKLAAPWGQEAYALRAPINAKPWYRATTVGAPMPKDAPDYMGALDVDTVWKVVEKRLNAGRGK